MKKPYSFLVIIFVMAFSAVTVSFGADAPSGESPEKSDSTQMFSFWHAIATSSIGDDATVFTPGTVMKNEVTVDLSHGLSFDVFWSKSLQKKLKTETVEGEDGATTTTVTDLSNGGNEIDFKLAYALPAGFEASVSYWDFYPLFGKKAGNVYVGELKWSHSVEVSKTDTVSFSSSFQSYKSTQKSEFTGGARGIVGLGYTKSFSSAWSLEATLNLGRDDGSFDTESAWFANASLGLSYVYKSVTIGAKVIEYKPFKVSEARVSHTVGELSFGWGF